MGDLFNVNVRGKRLTLIDREIGSIPFVTAGENNNGVSSYINNEKHTKYKNSITLDMFANTFYQNFEFKCDDNITVLKNDITNKYSSIFIVALLSKLSSKYSYGNQVRPNRLKKDKILLPINSNGEPDYAFMEQYMKTLEYEKLNKYIVLVYIKNRTKNQKN